MHVDGGASANIFFAGFMFDVQRAIEAQRLANGVEVDFYLIVNSPLLPEPLDLPVKGNLLSIAAASTWSMSWAAQSAQLIRMYKSIRGFGHAYHLAGIPTEYPDPLDSSTFDPESMTQLLQFAKRQAAEGYPWLDAPRTSSGGKRFRRAHLELQNNGAPRAPATPALDLTHSRVKPAPNSSGSLTANPSGVAFLQRDCVDGHIAKQLDHLACAPPSLAPGY